MARMVVGMSGGVDSSLSAVLLREQGHSVLGVTMTLWSPAHGENACCSPDAWGDGRAVAICADLPHVVLDMRSRFQAQVIDDFLAAYARGETPNPCTRCNSWIKFGDLWTYAQAQEAEAVATGHYARIVQRNGRFYPRRARDTVKDQSYFLFDLDQEQLAAARFPLGNLTKTEVRAMAAERAIVTADKPESQDICFIGTEGLAGFLRQHIPEAFRPGPIRLVDGREIGRHQGLAAYTIGQRRGLAVAWSEPLFVVDLDVSDNAVILGPRSATHTREAWLRDCRWHGGEPPQELHCLVRNRHRGDFHPAVVRVKADGSAVVTYQNGVDRPSPGQAGVCYDPDGVVLGGGWFCRRP